MWHRRLFSGLYASTANAMSKGSLRVAYLGPPASFSEQAAQEAFPPDTSATYHPLPSFKHILSAVQDSASNQHEAFDYAVLPIENSTNGGVVQVLDLLIQCGLDPSSCLFPDVEVVAEHYLEVHHCLYINRSQVPPNEGQNGVATSMDIPISKLNVTALYTHPQVWGQCNNFLSKHFSPAQTERIDMSSTSAAAAFVAQNPTTSPPHETPNPPITAAICSSLAGKQNNLAQVATNIEDEPGKNTTRFLVIRNSHLPSQLPAHLTRPMPSPTDPTKKHVVYHKSLLTFTVPHTMPGSLALALAIFQRHGFNLTAITSRPSRERNWHYVFFVECQKEAAGGEEASPSMSQGLVKDLQRVAERTCWLGSWVDRLKYE